MNTPVGTTNGSTTTFTDTGLQNGKQYFYFVAANNAVGGSPNSNEVSVLPSTQAPRHPRPPASPPCPATVPSSSPGTPAPPPPATASTAAPPPAARATTPIATPTTNSFTDTGRHQRHHLLLQGDRPQRRRHVTANSAEVSATPTSGGGAGLLSQGRPATASSTENGHLTAAKAFDGNTSTRWSSAFSDPQWIQVDLGDTHSINRIVLNWQTAYGRAFQLQTSANGTTWTTIYSTTTSTGGLQTWRSPDPAATCA